MRGWGIALMILGLAMLGFGVFMETVVSTPGGLSGSVNNLGLMADRLIIVLVGGFAFLSGVVMNVGAQLLDAIRPPEPGDQEPGKVKPGYTVGPGSR